MPVTKTVRECYEIRDGRPGGEWANITLHCWNRLANAGTPQDGIYYCGEITIQSSFGTWGHIWTACANPFKQFLLEAEFDYVFGKFMGAGLHEFDGEGSMRALRRRLIEHRRLSMLDKDEARALRDALKDCEEEATSSENDWVNALSDAARDMRLESFYAARFLGEPWELSATSPTSCAVSFWRELWPMFTEALREELAAECAPATPRPRSTN